MTGWVFACSACTIKYYNTIQFYSLECFTDRRMSSQFKVDSIGIVIRTLPFI